MSDESDLHETIRTVVKRAETLDRLARGPTSKRDLRDDLGVSRSTVYKAVRELEEQNLVAEEGGTIRLTLYGRLIVNRYRSFAGTVEDTARQQSLLGVLSHDAPVTTDLLVGADAVLAEPVAPDRPLNYLEDLIRASDRIVGFAPTAFRRYVELFHEQLVADALTADIVFERSVVDHLWADYADRFRKSVEADCYSLWVTDEPLPFGLVVAEGDRDEVAVVAYDEELDAKGVITNDAPAALDWGRDVFEQYRANATRVKPR